MKTKEIKQTNFQKNSKFKNLDISLKEMNKMNVFLLLIVILVVFVSFFLTSYALFSSSYESTNTIKFHYEPKTVSLDTSGANAPVLATGMIPVYYDSTSAVWRKADSTNYDVNYKWYDYNNKMWANAVTVTQVNNSRSDLVDALMGTEIPMDRINTMMVWIPRFSAVTPSNYNGGTADNPGAIDVTFVDNSTIAQDAFTFGEENLSGFWISKFEVSSDIICTAGNNSALGSGCNLNTINPKSIPNVTSWRGAQVSTFFTTMRAMEDDKDFYGFDNTIDTTLDTRMLKNSEWGAIAYLTHSIYGRCTSDGCSEVGINNNSGYITGYGAPAGSSSSVTNGTYETSLGADASTTGNIYGVYDMSGGAIEYVMGVYSDGTKYWSGYNTEYNSGFNGCLGDGCSSTKADGIEFFSIEANKKYFDAYTGTSYTGHALNETAGWYSDYSSFVNTSSPWFNRGGADDGTRAGLFYFFCNNGYAYVYHSSHFSLSISK